MNLFRLAALAGLMAGAPAAAKELPITGKLDNAAAFIVPATDWCSEVVSVEIRSTKDVVEKGMVEIQRLIGGTRGLIVADCPEAEIVRVRGLEKGKTIFLAYTQKIDGWRIRVVHSDGDILKLLRLDLSQKEILRGIAKVETQSHMARIGIRDFSYDKRPTEAEDVKINWDINDIQGETYVTILGDNPEMQTAELADQMANALINFCPEPSGLATDGDDKAIQVRGFECKNQGQNFYYGLVSIRIGNIATHFVLNSTQKQNVLDLIKLIADEKTLY